MGRFARVVVANVAYHMTQRGNARQFLLATDAERLVYANLFRTAVQLEGLSVLGFCLMPSHVHLVVVPPRAEALAVALKSTHGRYAAYMKRWSRQWTVESWRKFLEAGETETDRAALRRCTRTGRPLRLSPVSRMQRIAREAQNIASAHSHCTSWDDLSDWFY